VRPFSRCWYRLWYYFSVKKAKRLAAIRKGRRDVRPDELFAVLEAAGFYLSSMNGSHRGYRHPRLTSVLTIPFRRPVLPVYVDLAVAAIDAVAQIEAADTHEPSPEELEAEE
jgi:hypothetical protein